MKAAVLDAGGRERPADGALRAPKALGRWLGRRRRAETAGKGAEFADLRGLTLVVRKQMLEAVAIEQQLNGEQDQGQCQRREEARVSRMSVGCHRLWCYPAAGLLRLTEGRRRGAMEGALAIGRNAMT